MKSITLTGMSGSGKTTIGRLLAEKLDKQFIDIDKLIEQKDNRTINDIFSQSGEDYFRDLEAKIISDNVTNDSIISLGGGAFENSNTRQNLITNSIVIYLKASARTIVKRLAEADDRPLLKDLSIEKVTSMLETREKHYKLAQYTVITDNKEPEEIIEEIIKCLNCK